MEEVEKERAEHEQGSQGLGLGRLIWVSSAFLVVYVLSVGPVARIYRGKPRRPPTAVLAIYAPVDFSYKRSSVVKRFFDWYVDDVWHCKR